MSDSKAPLHCSFCGKSQHEVEVLIAGPGVHICSECVDLCGEIVEDKRANTPSREELVERIAELEGEVEDLGYELLEENDHT